MFLIEKLDKGHEQAIHRTANLKGQPKKNEMIRLTESQGNAN